MRRAPSQPVLPNLLLLALKSSRLFREAAAREKSSNELPEQGNLSRWSLAVLELTAWIGPWLGAGSSHASALWELPSGSQLCSQGPPLPRGLEEMWFPGRGKGLMNRDRITKQVRASCTLGLRRKSCSW